MASRTARGVTTFGDPARPIGPGRLVAVVGPSGAGKDTLLKLARARLHHDGDIVFPRRIVTRPPSVAEDNEYLSDAAFSSTMQAGAFAFWWDAHGLKYALSAALDDDIRAGRTVVCNVSRAIVGLLRRRYVDVAVILVTASTDVLAARLAARGRASDGNITARIDRPAPSAAELSPDAVLENAGDPLHAAMELVALIAAALPP